MLLPLLAALLLLSACRNARPEETASQPWRFAIEEIRGSVQDLYAQKFKQLIEEKSGGEIKVVVYPYGSLGTSDQVSELLHLGALQFAMASPGHLGKLIPELQLFLLHFVFSEDNRVNKEILSNENALSKRFAPLYRRKGMKLLAFLPEGWQVWTTRKPIRKPADFQGLKMRVMTSPMLIAAYEAYGANPTPLPYAEVYSALQLGMIEGQVNPVFAIEEMSFYEVTDYLVFANHAQFITSLVTNPAFFDRLSPGRRRLVLDTVAELNDFIFEVQERFNEERLEKIRRRKPDIEIIRLSEAERDLFRRASLPIRRTFVDSVGPSGERILAELLSEVARVESDLATDG